MRGKAAAQNANRRLAEAIERIAELECLLKQSEGGRKSETTSLRHELQRAQGANAREIKRLADERVEAARDRANEVIHESRTTHLAQVVAGCAVLDSMQRLATHNVGQWADVAEAFGVQAGPLIAGVSEARGIPVTRHVARTSNAGARWKAEIFAGIESGELHDPGGAHKPDRWREG